MAWRGIHLTEPSFLSLERNGLKVEREGEDAVNVPLEDLGWLIVDSNQVTLTSRLLSECTEKGVCVIFTDARHQPSAFLIPRFQYHRQLSTVRAQVAARKSHKDRLWGMIVKQKILNQSTALERVENVRETVSNAKAMKRMAGRVRNGDPDNIEALAAQSYWPKLFPGLVRRNDNDVRNAYLNYGYAIVRALLARELAALGFELSLALHHANTLNPFNLADDLLEPFRPLVDGFVCSHFSRFPDEQDEPAEFTKEDRQLLAALPQAQIRLAGESMSIFAAAADCAANLRAALVEPSNAVLELPLPLMNG